MSSSSKSSPPSSSSVLPHVPAKAAISSTFRPGIFDGKVVFSTGGRSGIGYGIVKAMMELGCDAVILGRNSDLLLSASKELASLTNRKCIGISADVRKPEEMKKAAQKAVEEFGRIDFVVCGAAGNFLAPIDNMSENAFRTVIEIDLIGTYNTIKATLPHVRKTKGSYVHISATLHYRGTPFQAHVSSAKAGVDALSAVLAVEQGPWGVRSNVIAPGPIGGTEGMDRLAPKGWDPKGLVPLGRMGDRDDIAAMAIFLFSEASSWITGTVMVVDGGDGHLRSPSLEYPKSVLDPSAVQALIKAKM